jgi:gamma-glutamylcyclotransferase (GGCT)/AIG2-like uncharacterized protein YtfP
MPLVFSYGTLQQEDVQRATFGRLLEGQRDALPGFALAQVRIEDPKLAAAVGRTHFANATRHESSRVIGMVFEITAAELTLADEYEQAAAYRRIAVMLASGKEAWVYVHASSLEPRHPEIEALVAALRADGRAEEARLLHVLLGTAWTTSSEFLGEVGLVLKKIEAAGAGRLSGEAKIRLEAAFAVVGRAWPRLRG